MKDIDSARVLLDEVSAAYKNILKENLVGIYEHGSLAFGCFNWEISDIDFLVVVKERPTLEEKIGLIRVLLERTDRAPDKGFEMSVVRADAVKPFQYPTPFELHFSKAHLESALKDLTAYCERMHGTDKDLAAHCTVIRCMGRTVVGKAIDGVFGEIRREEYLDSVWLDVENAVEDIQKIPVYMTMNLCRVLAAARNGWVLSKREGALWALERLDKKWRGLLRGALEAYSDGLAFQPEASALRAFAGDMLAQIEEAIHNIESYQP